MIQSHISREISWFYPWLRRLSSRLIGSEYRGKTLQPTALANEVIVKLLSWKGELTEETERSLRVLAATIAKQTLIDHGRRRSHRESYVRNYREENESRGCESEHCEIQNKIQIVLSAIDQLETVDPDLACLVRLRYFEGYSLAEATSKLGMSPRTAARRWAFAKAFLADAIGKG